MQRTQAQRAVAPIAMAIGRAMYRTLISLGCLSFVARGEGQSEYRQAACRHQGGCDQWGDPAAHRQRDGYHVIPDRNRKVAADRPSRLAAQPKSDRHALQPTMANHDGCR